LFWLCGTNVLNPSVLATWGIFLKRVLDE